MKPLLALTSVLLLTACTVLAQTYGSQDQSSQNSMSSSLSTMGNTQTWDGCLGKQGTDFVLTTNDGNQYKIAGDTSKLNAHVGHEMKITGTASQSSDSASNSGAGGSMMTAPATITLQSFQHVAAHCPGGAASGSGMGMGPHSGHSSGMSSEGSDSSQGRMDQKAPE